MRLIWKNYFVCIVEKHAPLKKREIGKKRSPWITKQILNIKRQNNYLKKKACKTNYLNDWKLCQSARNRYNSLIKIVIRSNYTKERQNNEGDMKSTWKSINKLLHK